MSGILLTVRELSGECQGKILSGKSVPKVFITSWIFVLKWVFSSIHSYFILCNHCEVFWKLIVWSFTYTSSTGMLWVPLDMGMSAAHCQGNVREFHSVWRVVTLHFLSHPVCIACICIWCIRKIELNLLVRLSVSIGECQRQAASLQRAWSYCCETIEWWTSSFATC